MCVLLHVFMLLYDGVKLQHNAAPNICIYLELDIKSTVLFDASNKIYASISIHRHFFSFFHKYIKEILSWHF